MTDRQRAAVDRIVTQLERDGYIVLVEPRPDAIPFELGGYQPDILATKGEEHIIVEVKTIEARRSLERYKSIASAVSQHPNWRFMLTTVTEDAELDDEVALSQANREELAILLKRLDVLIDSENYSFAVPYLWNALMSGLRTRAYERDVPVDATSDLRVINYMYSLGEISHEDFETLRRFQEMRNLSVHSIGVSVSKEQTLALRQYVHKKLAEWGLAIPA